MLKLTKFYELEISEVITQPIRSTHTNITYEGKLTHTHICSYELCEYTRYKLNDYLTTPQLTKPKYIHRQILTDRNIGFIDYIIS